MMAAAAAAAILVAVPNALAKLNTVLTQCGITAVVVEQTNLISNECFTLIEDIGLMKDDMDFYVMAKQATGTMHNG
jgi:hypothetical protein